MRALAIAALLLLLALTAPAATADNPTCPPFATTYVAIAGIVTDDYGNPASFVGEHMISPALWSGTATPITCGLPSP